MSLDRKGNKLHVNDIVMLPCRITGVDKHEDFYNVALETVEPFYPGNRSLPILCNAKQVELMAALGSSHADIDVRSAIEQNIEDSNSGIPVYKPPSAIIKGRGDHGQSS